MKHTTGSLAIVASLFATTAYGACEMPALVASIPDGETATEPELLAVQAEVRAYVEAMDDFIACQNEELTADGDNATSQYLHLMTERITAARREVDQVATEFNDQVAAFRAARQTSGAFRQN